MTTPERTEDSTRYEVWIREPDNSTFVGRFPESERAQAEERAQRWLDKGVSACVYAIATSARVVFPAPASPSPCRCVEVPGYGMDRTACRADEHRDFCTNEACCAERGHKGKCDERAAL